MAVEVNEAKKLVCPYMLGLTQSSLAPLFWRWCRVAVTLSTIQSTQAIAVLLGLIQVLLLQRSGRSDQALFCAYRPHPGVT